MADELISQEEINLILGMLSKGNRKEKRIRPLDLSIFERISSRKIPGLELVFERWASGLRRALASLVVTLPEVHKESLSITSFSNLVLNLPVPCAIGLFHIEPLRGTCILVVDPQLVYTIVSSVFGGGTKVYRPEEREFTRIEMRLIQRLFSVCYGELEVAWSSIMKVKINPVAFETNPSLLTLYRARERMAVAKLTVSVGDSGGNIMVAIPENAILPYRDLLKLRAGTEERKINVDNLKNFLDIPLKLEVVLGKAELTFGDILKLKKGDTLMLDKSVKQPLEVRVQNVGKLLAFLGQVENKRAIKIYKEFQEEG